MTRISNPPDLAILGKPKVEVVSEGVGGYLEALRYATVNAS